MTTEEPKKIHSVPETTKTMYEQLLPFTSEERTRIVLAALTLLGEAHRAQYMLTISGSPVKAPEAKPA